MIEYTWRNEIGSPGDVATVPGVSAQEVIPVATPEHISTPESTQLLISRLLRHVAVDAESGCWLWQGHTNGYGYGRFLLDGRFRAAHRVAYMLLVAPVPEDMDVHHRCRNRLCVNPDHLEPLSRHEHWLRGQSPSQINAAKDKCVNGHPFTEENTYVWEKGGRNFRHCRACARERARKYAAKRRNPIDARRKLTDKQLAAAVAEYQAGASVRAVAARAGVTYSAISHHLQRLGVPRRPRGRYKRSAVRR